MRKRTAEVSAPLRLRSRQKRPDPTNLERHYDPISAKRLKITPLPAHHMRKLGLVKKLFVLTLRGADFVIKGPVR